MSAVQDNWPHVVRFAVFEADLQSGELRKAGVRIALQDQPFRVLTRLLEHPGRVVTREELRHELWPSDTFVDFEHGVNVAIKRLRDALGDNADAPRFVETLPRRGYRFIAPVASARGRNDGQDASTAQRPSGGWQRARWWTLAGVTFMSGLIMTTLGVPRPRAVVTNRDTILVADLVNATGDDVFDGPLRLAIVTQLSQSPYFSVISRERMRDTLERMTRSPDDRVIGELARDVCQRVGAKATINGSIAALGRHYALGIEVLDCLSGETVASEQTEVSGREQVLAGLDSLTTRLRRRLGEPLTTIQRFNTPLERATTPSLEALKAFSIGDDILLRGPDLGQARQFFERAIEVDPEFALAYARLSSVSGGMGRLDDEIKYAQAAYVRRDRVSGAERFYIEGRHCAVAFAKGFQTDCFMSVHELWKRSFPQDWLPYSNLAAGYVSRGRYDDAIENGLEAIRLNPDEGEAYLIVADAYLAIGRFSDARHITDEALRRHLDADYVHEQRFRLAFIAGDEVAMAAERQAVTGTRVKSVLAGEAVEATAFYGHLKLAHALRTPSGLVDGRVAIMDAAVGLPDPLPDTSKIHQVGIRWAAASLIAGDVQSAATLMPNPSAGTSDWLPLEVAAGVLLAVDRGDRSAIDRLTRDSSPQLTDVVGYEAAYVGGLAYLHARDGAHAGAEFQQIIDHRGLDPTSLLYPLAYVEHARASALAGDRARARRDYEEFLKLWKDADHDIPVLKQARAEYASLTASAK